MTFIRAPEHFARFDDFIIDSAAYAYGIPLDQPQSDVEYAHLLRSYREYSISQILLSIYRRPVNVVIVDDPQRASSPGTLSKDGTLELPMLRGDVDYAVEANPPLEDRYAHVLRMLTGTPRQWPWSPTLWSSLLDISRRLMEQVDSPSASRRAFCKDYLLTKYPGGHVDETLARMTEIDLVGWSITLGMENDPARAPLAHRLATRLRQLHAYTTAASLYLQPDTDVTNIPVVMECLREDLYPDPDAETYASRCEFFAYLCKKMARTDLHKDDIHSCLDWHVQAIEALCAGIAAYPRPRLAKYIADHVACIAGLLCDDVLRLSSDMIYTYWYTPYYFRYLEDLAAEVVADPAIAEISAKAQTAARDEWNKLVAALPVDINPGRMMDGSIFSHDAAVLRDLHAGAIHNYKLLKGSLDEVRAFCDLSGLDWESLAENAGKMQALSCYLHAVASSQYASGDQSPLHDRIIFDVWNLCYPDTAHQSIAAAGKHLVNRLRTRIKQGRLHRKAATSA